MGSKLHLPLLPMETVQKHNLDTQEGDGDDPATVPGDSSCHKETTEDATMSVHGHTASSSVPEVRSDVFTNQVADSVSDNIGWDDPRCDLAELFTVADLVGGGGAADLSEQVLQLALNERQEDACLRSELTSETVLRGAHGGHPSSGQSVSHQTDTTESEEFGGGDEQAVLCAGGSSKDVRVTDSPVCLLGVGQEGGGGVSGFDLECLGDRVSEMRDEAAGNSGAILESGAPVQTNGEGGGGGGGGGGQTR